MHDRIHEGNLIWGKYNQVQRNKKKHWGFKICGMSKIKEEIGCVYEGLHSKQVWNSDG